MPLLFALLLVAPGARAIDLGVIGPTYEISEPHLLQMIEQRLHDKERSGELKRCLLYTSDAADERSSVDLGGRRIIKKKTQI